MSVQFPQIDKPSSITGSSDLWDNSTVGPILTADYFDAATPPTTSGIKTWNGSSWVIKPVKVWSGSVWAEKPVKRWNGTSWV